MKISRLFVFLFVISALPASLYAGQTDKSGGQEINAEPDCDYISVRVAI
jgi:hypothetical protein